MSYRKAEECFDENTGFIDSSKDPVVYNINNGLNNLTIAIESDMQEIKNLLEEILKACRR